MRKSAEPLMEVCRGIQRVINAAPVWMTTDEAVFTHTED